MSKAFLYEYQSYTTEALQLSDQVDKTLRPIFEKYKNLGLSYREISHLIILAVTGLQCQNVLVQASQLRKNK